MIKKVLYKDENFCLFEDEESSNILYKLAVFINEKLVNTFIIAKEHVKSLLSTLNHEDVKGNFYNQMKNEVNDKMYMKIVLFKYLSEDDIRSYLI